MAVAVVAVTIVVVAVIMIDQNGLQRLFGFGETHHGRTGAHHSRCQFGRLGTNPRFQFWTRRGGVAVGR